MERVHWRKQFDSDTLRKGYAYFQKGKIKGLISNNDSCMARVLGTKVYQVVISGLSSTRLNFYCSCPYAQKGNKCKHEAAVLYEFDKEHGFLSQEEAEEELEDLRPFSGNARRQELYFNAEVFTKEFQFDRRVFSRAESLVKRGKVSLKNVKLYYNNDYGRRELTALCEGTAEDRYGQYVPVTLRFTRNKITEAYCRACYRSYSSSYFYSDEHKELCEHETALLILADEYLQRFDPGDSTDWKASKILMSFGDIRAAEQTESAGLVKKSIMLVPRIIREPDGLQLGFRIGSGKLFVVKNLTDLVHTVEENGSLELGKSGAIHFSVETFHDEFMKYYEFVARQVKNAENLDARMHNMNRYVQGSVKLDGRILLSGNALDEFYSLAEGTKVEFSDKLGEVGTGSLVLKRSDPHVDLKIEPSVRNGRFDGVSVKGRVPDIYDGSTGHYFIANGMLSRLDEDMFLKVSPFREAAEIDGTLSFKVGLKNLPEFYYRVLPGLIGSNFIDVKQEQPEVIEANLSPEARFTFWLDLEGGRVCCAAQTAYGDRISELKELKVSDFPLPGYRDVSQEMKTVRAVSDIFPVYNEEEHRFETDDSDDAVYKVLDSGITTLMRFGEVQGTEAFNKLKLRRTPAVGVGVSVESDLMNLQINTEDMSPDELLELLESYRKKKRYHRLRNGDFVNLEQDDSLEMLSQIMNTMGVDVREFVDGKMHLPLYRALYIDKLLEEHDEIASERDRTFRKLVKNFKTVKDSDFEVPGSLRKVMRKYQVYGYKWLRTLKEVGFGGILADDMGLGKTLQMIAVFLAMKEERAAGTGAETAAGAEAERSSAACAGGEQRHSLIVCPASLVYNWQEEFRRFAPSLKVKTVTGNAAERKLILDDPGDTDVFVTSYDLLKRDIINYENLHFEVQVLDEAQYIKNPKAAVSKAVKIIRSDRRFALTGTPIENRLSELWSIFDYLMPGFLYEYGQFREEYETLITREKDGEATERLRKMVAPFILRRLKGDVLKDLPEKLEEVRYAKFEDEQQKLYDAQVVHMRELISNAGAEIGKRKIEILAELTKIRQVCCDPSLIVDGYGGESAKRAACIDLVKSAIDGGHRMLLFSQFTSMLSLIEEELKKEHIQFFKITGSTPKEERLALVHEFNEGGVPVFLISLKAGGTGLNLTGADMVIHYDPWWNLAAQNQATDRAHRIGQKRQVTVYKLIAKDTIEERILEMQEAKKDLADAILSGASESLTQLTGEELLELLT